MTHEPHSWDGKHVLVMGLGRFGGGVGVCRFLAERGAHVTVTDRAPQAELAESIRQLHGLPITFHLGGHIESDFLRTDLIVVNPAVKKDSLWLKLAADRKIPLTSEMNLFFQVCPAPLVGVTGSNGKSTTTAMIGRVLQTQYTTWIGGNLGRGSLLAQIDRIAPDHLVVLELSSFQLYDLAALKRSPPVAVVTNIAPNHLDWHGAMEDYVAAKQNIFRYQQKDDVLLLNRTDPPLESWAGQAPGQVRWYPDPSPPTIPLKVPGRHNQINAAAALAVADLFDIDRAPAAAALADFPGLPHRLEFVCERDGVKYYNDSIATTPESVLVALEAFSAPKVLILGGYDKKIPFDGLVRRVVGGVEVAVVLGQVRETLYELIEKEKHLRRGKAPLLLRADDFDHAIRLAREHAPPGGVVLLSPACASYDMFNNFQQRGERFRRLVENF